jgi:UDP-glucose 4-epimerase
VRNKGTILVTGGAGYIGSHTIVEILNNSDYNVISADVLLNSTLKTYERIHQITGVNIKNYTIDLCDIHATEQIFKENNITGVIHFAALKSVPESVKFPLKYYYNNINSLVNILHCMKKFNVNNFIFSSSCSVYGNVAQLPVNENTPMGEVQSPYAYTKVIGEKIIEDFCYANASHKSIALRYFNPVGAHTTGLVGELPINAPNNLVPYITKVAIGELSQLTVYGDDYTTRDGTCIRDYVHVSDIAHAHLLALNYLSETNVEKQFDVINLGSGNGVTVLEAIQAFEKINNISLNYTTGPRRPGDIEAIYSDSSKAKNLLGWDPRYNLDDMMESAWKWQKNISLFSKVL